MRDLIQLSSEWMHTAMYCTGVLIHRHPYLGKWTIGSLIHVRTIHPLFLWIPFSLNLPQLVFLMISLAGIATAWCSHLCSAHLQYSVSWTAVNSYAYRRWPYYTEQFADSTVASPPAQKEPVGVPGAMVGPSAWGIHQPVHFYLRIQECRVQVCSLYFHLDHRLLTKYHFLYTTTTYLYALSSIPVDSSKKLASSNQDDMSRSLVHLTAPLREKRGHSPKIS